MSFSSRLFEKARYSRFNLRQRLKRWQQRRRRRDVIRQAGRAHILDQFEPRILLSSDFVNHWPQVEATVELEDGTIVAALDSGSGDFEVAQFGADGQFAPSFGTGGRISIDIDVTWDFAASITLDENGRYVIGGFAGDSEGIGDSVSIRVLSDGTLDLTYGVAGREYHESDPAATPFTGQWGPFPTLYSLSSAAFPLAPVGGGGAMMMMGGPVTVVDDGDAGYSDVGNWEARSNVEAYQGDWRRNVKGSGTEIATWQFTDVPAGWQDVYVTWKDNTNRAVDAEYTIYDGDAATGQLEGVTDVNQTVAPDDVLYDGSWWRKLGTFDVQNGTLTVELSDDFETGTYLSGDAVRYEAAAGAPAAPTLVDDGDLDYSETGIWNPTTGTTEHYDGDKRKALRSDTATSTASWTFEDVPVGWVEVYTTWKSSTNQVTDAPYTVFDDTTALGTIDVNQQLSPSDGWFDGVQWHSLGVFEVNSESLVVELTNASDHLGVQYVIADAVRYETRTGSAAPAMLIDDGDLGFSDTGGWESKDQLDSHEDDLRRIAPGGTLESATWSFDGLAVGEYEVLATWRASSSRVTDAPFTIYDGATPITTIDVNQQVAPSDGLFNGVQWHSLGQFTITGDELNVELTNDASGGGSSWVIADAVRLEAIQVTPTVTVEATTASVDEDSASPGVFTVTLAEMVGAPVDVHYTVGGTATSVDDYAALTGTVTVPANTLTATVDVSLVDDTLFEPDETVSVSLSADAAYILGATTDAELTIIDNEPEGEATLYGAPSIEEGVEYVLNITTSDYGITGGTVDWGDGATTPIDAGVSEYLHTYADGGATYDITVLVDGDNGATYQAGNFIAEPWRRVTVTDVAPTLVEPDDTLALRDVTYTLPLAVTEPGQDTVTSWLVDFGDGSAVQQVDAPATSADHTYTAEGDYPVTVTAIDEDGSHDLAPFDITVADLKVTGASEVDEGDSYTVGLAATPGVTVTNWHVDWGDGNVETLAGSATDASHTYPDGPLRLAVSVTADIVGETEPVDAGQLIVDVVNVAPTVTVSGPTQALAGETYTLNVSATGEVGGDTIEEWTIFWGDGTSDTFLTDEATFDVEHVYLSGGDFVIGAVVQDDDGAYLSNELTVSLPDRQISAPEGGATVDEGSTFTISLYSDDDLEVTSWDIDWGDGEPADTLDAANGTFDHVYANGTVVRTITATPSSDTQTYAAVTLDVTVNDVAPTAVLSGLPIAAPNDPYTLNLLSTDPAADSLRWEITVTHDATQNAQNITVNDGSPSVDVTFTATGAHTITATVYDDAESISVIATPEHVEVETAGAAVTGPAQSDEGESYILELNAAGFVPSQWVIDWGDGVVQTINGHPAQVEHTYADDAQSVDIDATAYDGATPYAATTVTIDVENAAPTVEIEGAPLALVDGTYDLGLATNNVGDDTITQWTIDWGDGTVENFTQEPTAESHTYTSAGSYTISIDVTDEDGTHIDVAQLALDAADFIVTGPSEVEEGSQLTLDVAFSANFTPDTLVVDWKDGTVDSFDDTDGDPNNDIPTTLSHTYADGTQVFSIDLTATDASSNDIVQTHDVTVLDVAPTATALSPNRVDEGTSFAIDLAYSDVGDDAFDKWVIDWGDGSATQEITSVEAPGGTANVAHAFPDGPANHIIRIKAVDADGLETLVSVDLVADPDDVSFAGLADVGLGLDARTVHKIADAGDGTYIVAGSNDVPGETFNFAVYRFDADGRQLDVFDPVDSGGDDFAKSVTVDSQGRAVVVGYLTGGGDTDILVARYNTDGTLDTTFDSDGFAVIELGGNEFVYDVTTHVNGDGDDVITLVGATDVNGTFDIALLRLNEEGTPDELFGLNGGVITDLTDTVSANEVGYALEIDAVGRIVVAGSTYADAARDVALLRYHDDGSLDERFGTGGSIITDFGATTGGEVVTDVLVDGSRILVAGYSDTPGILDDNAFLLASFTDDGGVDTSFGTDGRVFADIGPGRDEAFSVSLDSDGRLLIAGHSRRADNVELDPAIARFNPDGTLDTTLNGTGMLTGEWSGTEDYTYGLVQGGDGRFLLPSVNPFGGTGEPTIAVFTTQGISQSVVLVVDVLPQILIAGDDQVDEGVSYGLTLVVLDPGHDPMAEWTVDWGDEVIETYPGGQTGVSHVYDVSHSLIDAEGFEIVATVVDQAGGETLASKSITVVNQSPVAPHGLVGALTADGEYDVQLTWPASVRADGYLVYRRVLFGNIERIGTVGAVAEPSFLDEYEKLTPRTDYDYFVTTVHAAQESQPSNVAFVKTKPRTPIAPTNVAGSRPEVGTANVELTWSPAPEAHGYRVYRSSDGQDSVLVSNGIVEDTSFTDTDLSSSIRYTYEVTTVYYNLESETSDQVVVLEAPDDISLEHDGTTITIDFASVPNVDPEESYLLYRNDGTIEAPVWTEVDRVSSNSAETLFSEAGRGEYRVTAVHSSGPESLLSDASVLVRIDNPGTPESDSDGVDGTGVHVTWTAVKEADSYDLYRDGALFAESIVPGDDDGDGLLTFKDQWIDGNKAYEYQVKARLEGGESVSNEVEADETAPLPPFDVVASLSVGGSGPSVSLSWDDSWTGAFRAEYASDPDSTTWTDLEGDVDDFIGYGETLYYRVVAINVNDLESPPSRIVRVDAPPLLTAPDPVPEAAYIRNFHWAPASQGDIYWRRVPRAEGYRIYWRIDNSDDWTQLPGGDVIDDPTAGLWMSLEDVLIDVDENDVEQLLIIAYNEAGDSVETMSTPPASDIDGTSMISTTTWDPCTSGIVHGGPNSIGLRGPFGNYVRVNDEDADWDGIPDFDDLDAPQDFMTDFELVYGGLPPSAMRVDYDSDFVRLRHNGTVIGDDVEFSGTTFKIEGIAPATSTSLTISIKLYDGTWRDDQIIVPVTVYDINIKEGAEQIVVREGDVDNDQVPDSSDGFDWDRRSTSEGEAVVDADDDSAELLSPFEIEVLPAGIFGAGSFRVEYNGFDPDNVSRAAPAIADTAFTFGTDGAIVPQSRFRLWQASEMSVESVRGGGNYIVPTKLGDEYAAPPDQNKRPAFYSASELGIGGVTQWFGQGTAEGGEFLRMLVDPDGPDGVLDFFSGDAHRPTVRDRLVAIVDTTFVAVNDDDDDADGIVDFADLDVAAAANQSTEFLPLYIPLPYGLSDPGRAVSHLRFTYKESNPINVYPEPDGDYQYYRLDGQDDIDGTFDEDDGAFRIWTKPETVARNANSDFIPSLTSVDVSGLQSLSDPDGTGLRVIRVYVESVRPYEFADDDLITVEWSVDETIWTGIDFDAETPQSQSEMTIGAISGDLVVDSTNDSQSGSHDPLEPSAAKAIAIDNQNEMPQTGQPGLIVDLHRGDADADGIPDYADMLLQAPDDDEPQPREDLTPVVIELRGFDEVSLAEARIRISYSASDPAGIRKTGSGASNDPHIHLLDGEISPGEFEDDAGFLRLWTAKNSTGIPDELMFDPFFVGQSTETSWYVPPTGLESSRPYYEASWPSLGLQGNRITLFAEGVRPSTKIADQIIHIEVDPDGDGPASFMALDDVAITVSLGNLAIDSNNDSDGLLFDQSNAADEAAEGRTGSPGKLILVNDGDKDGDGFPDLVDGFTNSLIPPEEFENVSEWLVPMVIELPDFEDQDALDDVRLSFGYDASDPNEIGLLDSDTIGFTLPGSLRIWTIGDGFSTRDGDDLSLGGDYVAPDTDYALDDFFNEVEQGSDGIHRLKVYVEAVRPSETLGDLSIEARIKLSPSAETAIPFDTVKLTAVRALAADLQHGPVNLLDGTVEVNEHDLLATSFDIPWSVSRTYSNRPTNLSNDTLGEGWSWGLPQLQQMTNAIVVQQDGADLFFDLDSSIGSYSPRFARLAQLEWAAGDDYRLIDESGTQWLFNGFDSEVAGLRGTLKEITGPSGKVTTIHRDSTNGRIMRVDRGDGQERFVYHYFDESSQFGGLIRSVALERQVRANAWTTIGSASYTYYGDAEDGAPYAMHRGLKQVDTFNADGVLADTKLYRYSASSSGAQPRLALIFGNEGLERLKYSESITAPSDKLKKYADIEIIYQEPDSEEASDYERVATVLTRGGGASVLQGDEVDRQADTRSSATYSYTTTEDPSIGPNIWYSATSVNDQAGAVATTYVNGAGQPMLSVVEGANEVFYDFTQYDNQGRPILLADSTAVSIGSLNPHDLLQQEPDLLEYSGGPGGDYELLHDDRGLVTTLTYFAGETTATSGDPGDVDGLLQFVDIHHGEFGASIPQEDIQYVTTSVAGVDIFHTGSTTAYRDTVSRSQQSGITTQFKYDFSQAHINSIRTLLPIVSASEHGDGTQVVLWEQYDEYGRLTEQAVESYQSPGDVGVIPPTDVHGKVAFAYDDFTGGQTLQSVDPDVLNLRTKTVYDVEGRPVAITDPGGLATSIRYIDDVPDRDRARLVETTTGTSISRVLHDLRDGVTYSASYALDSDQTALNGSRERVLSFGREEYDLGGRVVHLDEYGKVVDADSWRMSPFADITSVTQDLLANEGDHQGSDRIIAEPLSSDPYTPFASQPYYFRTIQRYDAAGNLERAVNAVGTHRRTQYDALGRPTLEQIGLSANELYDVTSYEYDPAGNLERVTQHPGDGAPDRVREYLYDWRGRLVVRLSPTGGETHSFNYGAPHVYLDYDNLGNVVAESSYSATSNISPAGSEDAPIKPASDELRGLVRHHFDALGREYLTDRIAVHPVHNGTEIVGSDYDEVESESLRTYRWFNERSLPIKEQTPGGLSTKIQYDQAGRATVVSLTDHGADSPTDAESAANLDGDIVLQQTLTQYDANGNALLLTTHSLLPDKQSSASSETWDQIDAIEFDDFYRTNHVANWFDSEGRNIATVNYGTNPDGLLDPDNLLDRPPARDAAHIDNKLLLSTTEYVNGTSLPKRTVDARGVRTDYKYDSLGRVQLRSKGTSVHRALTVDSVRQETVYRYNGIGQIVAERQSTDDELTSVRYFDYDSSPYSNDWLYRTGTSKFETTDSDPWDHGLDGVVHTTYNAVGETVWREDRNKVIHVYSFDAAGRPIGESVFVPSEISMTAETFFDSIPDEIFSDDEDFLIGTDNSIQQLVFGFDEFGRPRYFASYSFNETVDPDDPEQPGPVSSVIRQYNGYDQVIAETQSGPRLEQDAYGDTFSHVVNYTYSAPSALANHSRLVTIDYNTGTGALNTVVNLQYDSPLSDAISRIDSIKDQDQNTIETYQYLGLSEIDSRVLPTPELQYTRVLDRFGRVVEDEWSSSTDPQADAKDHFKYYLDANGNVIARENLVNPNYSEHFYRLDASDRPTRFMRGKLTTDANGLPVIAKPWLKYLFQWQANGSPEGLATDHRGQPIFNNIALPSSGDQTRRPRRDDETTLANAMDAWGRLAVAGWVERDLMFDDLERANRYAYDALNRQIGSLNDGLYIVSTGGQVLIEAEPDDQSNGVVAGTVYIYSPVDGRLIARIRPDGSGGVTRHYALQDARGNVSAVADASGTVLERYTYAAYAGVLSGRNPVRALDIRSANFKRISPDDPFEPSAIDWVHTYRGDRYDVVIDGFHHAGGNGGRAFDLTTASFLQASDTTPGQVSLQEIAQDLAYYQRWDTGLMLGQIGVVVVGGIAITLLTGGAAAPLLAKAGVTGIAAYVGTQGVLAAGETIVEGATANLVGDDTFNPFTSFAKNLGLNLATGGIGGGLKAGRGAVRELGKFATRQLIEIPVETAFDVVTRDVDVQTALAINTIGSVGGEALVTGLRAGVRGLAKKYAKNRCFVAGTPVHLQQLVRQGGFRRPELGGLVPLPFVDDDSFISREAVAAGVAALGILGWLHAGGRQRRRDLFAVARRQRRRMLLCGRETFWWEMDSTTPEQL